MNCVKWVLVLCAGVFFCVCPAVVWGGDELVSSVLLNQAGLVSNWQIQLPLKPIEQVQHLYIQGNFLYVLTDQNFFFCIERDSGSVRSLLPLAVAGLPITPPIQYENKSVFLTGQEIQVFDPAVGRITKTLKLPQLNSSSAGIARNSNTFYVCGSDNRLYAFSVDEGVRLFMVTADNDSLIHSVIASDKIIWFATAAGNIVAMDTSTHKKIWQYNMTGNMKTPPIMEEGFLYAAGLDAKLYKLDSKLGSLVWKEPFITGDAVRETLVLGKTCVYVFTSGTGLYAVNKQTGKAVWNLPRGRSVLAELGDQSYVYVQPGSLSLMDHSSGKEELSVNIAGVDRFAVNTTDSVLYLADSKGRIMAAGQISDKKAGIAKP